MPGEERWTELCSAVKGGAAGIGRRYVTSASFMPAEGTLHKRNCLLLTSGQYSHVMSEQHSNRLEDLAQHLEEPARPPLEPPCIAHSGEHMDSPRGMLPSLTFTVGWEGPGSVMILVLLPKCPSRA